jgi:alcohol dehydrogenase class IV
MNLNFLMPSRLVMGENCVFEKRALLAALGEKALVVTGKKSARTNGALDDTIKALEANNQNHVLYDSVMSNPTDACVSEAGKLAREQCCDFVIGIGGGSPMDAAKAIAVLAKNNISKEEMFSLAFTSALPIAAIPTTAGTGSETTPYSVLVDTTEADSKTPKAGGPAKRSVGSPLLFPQIALLDAKYMRPLNRDITVHTAIDALSHAVEGMLTFKSNYFSDMLAGKSIEMILGCMDALLEFPSDPFSFPMEIREKLLLASAIAGMVIAQSGTAAPHSMGYHFTLNWGTDHGRANGLLMKSFLLLCREKEKIMQNADNSFRPRIPKLRDTLGMELEEFFELVEKLLGKREKASGEEIKTWSALPMKNAFNTYTTPDKEEIEKMFRESVG